MTKNDIFTAEITGYGNEGLGVCHFNGRAVFVRGAARGDICEVRAVKVTSAAAWGKIERIIEPSPYRTDSGCPAFPACGGCDLRHISYEEELEFKLDKVEQALKRIGGTDIAVERIIAAEETAGYRNKAIIPIAVKNGAPVMGFYRSRSHDIVQCERCDISAPEINLCADVTRAFLERYGTAAARHLMVRSMSGGVQAALVTGGEPPPHIGAWADMLREKLPDIKSILAIENTRDDNVLMTGRITELWGGSTLTERLDGLEFEIHPFAFAQVNSRQAERLYELVVEFAAPDGCAAADLYCGTGTLSLFLARRAKKVYGVEIEPSAVDCAKRNAVRNGIANAEFILGDAGTVKLPERPDVAVVDPPRSGLGAAAVKTLADSGAKRIVYVSCDPATLARDVRLLAERGYRAERCAAVDMFPRTRHVECVVLLSRGGRG